jgi:AcrR family transcriptional regulator
VSTTLQSAVDRLPRGPHSLSRAQVEHHQRERILAATIAAVGTKGYRATTIADITRRARVSRDTFYQQFESKERCFLAAYDAIVRALLKELVALGAGQSGYVQATRDGVRSYLGFWSERPHEARVCTLEIMTAGELGLLHRERMIERFARLFRAVAERAVAEQPGLPAIPDIVPRAIVVATLELVTDYVRLGRTGALLELEDDLTYLWLMGLAGHEVAAAALRDASAPRENLAAGSRTSPPDAP